MGSLDSLRSLGMTPRASILNSYRLRLAVVRRLPHPRAAVAVLEARHDEAVVVSREYPLVRLLPLGLEKEDPGDELRRPLGGDGNQIGTERQGQAIELDVDVPLFHTRIVVLPDVHYDGGVRLVFDDRRAIEQRDQRRRVVEPL